MTPPLRLTRAIVRDTREQNGCGWFLDTPAGVEVRRATLATGDYTVSGLAHLVLVERKTVADLVACTGRERSRFEAELARLRDSTRFPWLVVEGDVSDIAWRRYPGAVAPSAVVGSLLSWCLDYEVRPWWGSTVALCERAVLRLFAAIERRVERGELPAAAEATPCGRVMPQREL